MYSLFGSFSCCLCHAERSRLYLNERIKRGFVEPKAKSGFTSRMFYNTLTDRPFDYAQGDRDSMNREANITVKVLADTNNFLIWLMTLYKCEEESESTRQKGWWQRYPNNRT